MYWSLCLLFFITGSSCSYFWIKYFIELASVVCCCARSMFYFTLADWMWNTYQIFLAFTKNVCNFVTRGVFWYMFLVCYMNRIWPSLICYSEIIFQRCMDLFLIVRPEFVTILRTCYYDFGVWMTLSFVVAFEHHSHSFWCACMISWRVICKL